MLKKSNVAEKEWFQVITTTKQASNYKRLAQNSIDICEIDFWLKKMVGPM